MIGEEDITLERRSAPDTVGPDGRAILGATQVSTIRAAVQPARGRDLRYLTEGLRQTVELVVYIHERLRTADPETGRNADRLVIDGERFEVVHVESHRSGIAHDKAFIRRLTEGQA